MHKSLNKLCRFYLSDVEKKGDKPIAMVIQFYWTGSH